MASLPTTSTTVTASLSAFGKTSAHGDFIRIRTASPAASFVQRWIEDAHARRVSSGIGITTQLVQFAIVPPDSNALVIGAIVPSRDSVGRSFPLSAFATIEIASAPQPELVPVAAQAFLEAVGTLLALARTASTSELEAFLDALPPVLEGSQDASVLVEETKRSQRIETLAERCFGEPATLGLAYAIDTIAQSLEAARSPKSAGRELVLSCPMVIDVDLFAWLSLMSAMTQERRPSFVWTEEKPELLSTFGPPTGALLGFVERQDSRSSALWPLVTQNDRARVDAIHRLPIDVRQYVERGGTLGELISCVTSSRSTWR